MIITYLESFNNKTINKNLNKLFESNNLDKRMECVDNIINELESLGVDVSEVEDDIKDLTLH